MSNNFATSHNDEEDLLGSFTNEPTTGKTLKREHDSTDDFEHLENESFRHGTNFSDDLLANVARNLDSKNETLGNKLLSSSGFERDSPPVPATPPPSASSADFMKFEDSASSDSFRRVIQDSKNASMAFMEAEKLSLIQDRPDDIISKPVDSFSNFDFGEVGSSKPDFLEPERLLAGDSRDDDVTSSMSHAKEPVPESPVLTSPRNPVLEEDWSDPCLGKVSKEDDAKMFSDFSEPPTKPLPPLPREAEFEAPDQFSKFDVSSDYGAVEAAKTSRQSGTETGDSEFESEAEPSPAKSSIAAKAESRASCRLPGRKMEVEEIAPKDIFKHLNLDAWFNPERLNPKVAALIYWRNPKKSGIVFGAILGVLLSLAYFSLISVLAYVSLLTLIGTIAFRIYKTVLQAIQKTSDGHPFKEILELDLTLPAEKVHEVADVAVANANAAVRELRRLFLVEDFIDSIKFGIMLWCLTYVGAWFNGMTLIIIGVVALFTLPKVYETNKAQIDQNLSLVQAKINEITAKVKAAIPLGKKEPVKEE